jgi:hypothetical protein
MTHAKEADGKWVYPSEQMFYNSMMRKGFAPNEKEMGTVVLIHNAVNEQAWREVVRWEQTFHSDCPKVKLSSFMGKPRELCESLFDFALLLFSRLSSTQHTHNNNIKSTESAGAERPVRFEPVRPPRLGG